MDSNLYKNVLSNIKWNAIESFFYSFLMIAHQAALFKILDIKDYGLIGSIFSYIFFSELTLCLGLNNSAGTFLSLWSENKKGFRFFFGWNMAINYGAASIYCVIGYFTVCFISPSVYILVAAIIILEMNKQICKTILHILFKSRIKSFIELISFAIFLAIVWGQYLRGVPITISSLLVPFFITSLVSCYVYLHAIFQWYNQLPNTPFNAPLDRNTIMRIVKNRLFSITHKTSKRFFSSNFLIPIIATRFGMGQAGIFKITTQIAYYTTLVLRKAFGNASSALFAHTKNSVLSKTIAHAGWITTLLTYATAGIIGSATIVALILHWYMPETFTLYLTILIITCFCNAGVMNSITTFEQWFIIHEKALLLISAQLSITGFWTLILMFSHTISPLQLFITATVFNILLFTYLGFIIFMHQKIDSFYLRIKTILNLTRKRHL